MTFDWDDANREHLARHGVSTEEVEDAHQSGTIDIETQLHEQDGYRYLELGETMSGRILVLLSTQRGNAIRVISAWDAPKGYKDFYLRERARQTWNQ